MENKKTITTDDLELIHFMCKNYYDFKSDYLSKEAIDNLYNKKPNEYTLDDLSLIKLLCEEFAWYNIDSEGEQDFWDLWKKIDDIHEKKAEEFWNHGK